MKLLGTYLQTDNQGIIWISTASGDAYGLTNDLSILDVDGATIMEDALYFLERIGFKTEPYEDDLTIIELDNAHLGFLGFEVKVSLKEIAIH